jgi:magnesium transporter
MVRTYLFDESEARQEVTLGDALPRLKKNQLLWIDLEAPSEQDLDGVAAALDLQELSGQQFLGEGQRPQLRDFGEYFQFNARAVKSDGRSVDEVEIGCVAGRNWVLTVHDQSVDFIEDFRERATGAGEVGRLDSPSFLAALLEWLLTSYLLALEEVELELERFDVRVMESDGDDKEDKLLPSLVTIRRVVGQFHRAAAAHREVLLGLANPQFDVISSSESGEQFRNLVERLEQVLRAVDSTRESVLGSFDVFIARTGQRTNEIMKILTLASIILLPAVVIGGIMGMNFKVGLFEHAVLYWVVIAVMLFLAFGTLAVARLHRWV